MDRSSKEAVKVSPLPPQPSPTRINHQVVSENNGRTQLIVVLRNASAYSCILSKPLQIRNIRGKRHQPGLKQQHLSGLQLLTEITNGQLHGGFVKSTEITLTPGKEGIARSEFTSDQHGAGYYILSTLCTIMFVRQGC